MKLLFGMKSPLRQTIPLVAWLACCLSAAASEIYFAPVTPSDVAASLVRDYPDSAVGSGGDLKKLRIHSGPGLFAEDPESPGEHKNPTSGAITLEQAAISPSTSSPLGYPTQETDSISASVLALQGAGTGLQRIPGASEYRYGSGQNGGTNANWNIQFDGVPPKTPSIPQNYYEGKIDDAIDHARVAIRANPYRTGQGSAYALLIQAAYEKAVPRTYAGNEWRALADRERLESALNKTIHDRILTLEQARDQYRAALAPLHALLNHPEESIYLWNASSLMGNAKPDWAGAGQTWTSLLYESYANAVQLLGECQFEIISLRYFRDYRVPGTGSFNPQSLVEAAESAAAEIERLLLPFNSLLERAGVTPRLELSSALVHSSRLKKLALEISEKSLSFDSGESEENGGGGWVRRVYSPYDVPFYSQDDIFGSSLTFNNLMKITAGTDQTFQTTTSGLIGSSKVQDGKALTELNNVIDSSEKLVQFRQGIEEKYLPQLRELCGARLSDPADPNSELVPDILEYLLPLEDRRPFLDAFGESPGAIGEQWLKIQAAENRLLSAIQLLNQVDQEIEVVRQFGNQRLMSFDRIAKIQLESGEAISALDYMSGEIRAAAIRAEADARAKAATKKSWLKAAVGVVASGIAAYATAGATWVMAAAAAGSSSLNGALAIDGAKDQAALYRQVGKIQASSTLRLARIQQQQTRLRAIESAKIAEEQQFQEDNRIDEQIHKLMITVESRRLEILYAEQNLDLAELELVNLIGRVNYLLQEYRKSQVRQSDSTLNRPDLRLRRDYEIREANRIFRFAQEYTYLCARSAEYRFLTPAAQTAVRAEISKILQAQNAADLEESASTLVQIRDNFFNSQQGRPNPRRIRLSLRNYVIQSNELDGYMTLNGSWVNDVVPPDAQFLHYPVTTNSGETSTHIAELSDAQLLNYLRDRLVGHPTLSRQPGNLNRPYLEIAFRTGYEKDYGGRSNPFYITGEYGHLIEGPNMPLSHPDSAGVFVNMRNNRSALTGIDTVSVQIVQQGVSFIPHVGLPNGEEPVVARAWNLPEVTSSIPAIWNQDTANTTNWKSLVNGNSQLNERSPACQRWVLRISGSQNFWTQMLPTLRDIELCMSVRGWTSQNGLTLPPNP